MMGKENFLISCVKQQRDDISVQLLLGTSVSSTTSSNESDHNFLLCDFDNGPKELDFFLEDGSVQRLVVEENLRAIDLCHVLALKLNVSESCTWTLVEQLSEMGMERTLEEHEEVLQVYADWGPDSSKCQNKFVFRQDFRKYELFLSPQQFFPLNMLNLGPSDFDCLSESADVAKMITLQNILNSGEKPPPIQGFMYFRESSKASWKRQFFRIDGATLYTGASKDSKLEPCRDLIYHDIYCPIPIESEEKPTSNKQFVFYLKPSGFCATQTSSASFYVEAEDTRQCWVATLRLAKFGKKLRENYKELKTRFAESSTNYQSRKTTTTSTTVDPTSDYTPMKTLVAMDFTGDYGGRVIEDPREEQAIAAAEGHAWRRKISSRTTTSTSGTQSLSQSPVSKAPFEFGVHTAQPWFYSDLSREEAKTLLKKYGTVNGVFLVRESHRHLGSFVLDYIYKNNVHHAEIIPVEERHLLCYSLDNGKTKFYDLIQLVEFYQLNLGSLPTKLTHFLVHRPKCKDTNK